ncbi:MAG: hypothetical protein ACI85V_002632 [bacterium]|jgi:hypothetical protein
MTPDGVGERFELGGGFTPPCEGGAIQVQTLTGEDLRLVIQRQVIRVFVHQYMGQKPRAGSALLNRSRRHWGLADCLTALAGRTRADDLVHNKAAWDVFQLFCCIATQLTQHTAAVVAAIASR